MPEASGEPAGMSRGIGIVLLLATAKLIFHLLTNGAYGFHRDELVLIDDARFLDWGYVAYPPLTPLVARIAIELFGTTTTAIRAFGALSQSLIMILVALMTRRLGGGVKGQVISALAVAIAPMSMIMTSLFQYITLDALWWVVVAWGLVALIDSGDQRWWLVIGTAIGLGMMTKYTMAYWVVALVGGVFVTPLRRQLRSPWLWFGAAISLLIWLPNLLWQYSHDFVSFEFLGVIHQRDIEWGRTDGFLIQQFFVTTSAVTIPLWMAGLWYFWRDEDEGRRYRIFGWMFVLALLLMIASRARFYYLFPAFAPLFAGGGVAIEKWLEHLRERRRRIAIIAMTALFITGAASSAALMLPLAPVNSAVWDVTAKVHDNFREQIGWPELVETVASVWHELPENEKERAGIFASNYGEAGAINLYGPEHGLPEAISGTNSYWYRGYGDEGPDTLIVLGSRLDVAQQFFRRCEVVAEVTNSHGVENEESREPNDVILCRDRLAGWSEIWPKVRSFG